MKIAMIGHKRVPSREGGIEIVVTELALRLAAMGCEVTCYNRNSKHVAGDEFDNSDHRAESMGNVKLKWVPTPDNKKLNAVVYSFFASVKAAAGNYDLIHFHAEGPSSMIPIAKLFNKKCVVTIHGLDWQRAKWGGFATKFLLFGEKTAAKYADEIIVLSENVQKYFKTTYNRDTVYIPNGITPVTKRSDGCIKSRFGLSRDSYFLYLGRIVPEKGLDYLVDAYNRINTDKKLVIAGSASHSADYCSALKEKAKSNPDIIFTGFVDGEILESLYSNTYAYCLPSDLEGMPLSLLEAMSCGNCCVVSDIPECINITGDRALHFSKGNVGELSQILQMLTDDKSIVDTYRSISAKYVNSRFNWDDIAVKTMDVYKKAVGSERR